VFTGNGALTTWSIAHYKPSGKGERMRVDAAADRYTGTAIVLHWLSALLIVGGFTLGISMVDLPISRQKLEWYAYHKWIGITVFLLTCARLGWRALHVVPAPVPMPAWQQRSATISHRLLYVLLLIIPVSGWIYSSSTGVQVVYLNLIPLPDLVPKDKELAAVLKAVHVTLNFSMLALVCLHTAAALKHHFVDHDGVLTRMLPRPRHS